VGVTSLADRTTETAGSGSAPDVPRRITAVELFVLSAWCGLASGLAEVGSRVACRAIDPTQRLYFVSRHFVWLGPLSSLLFFSLMGLLLAFAVRISPAAARWLGLRAMCACAILPVLLAAEPRIYPEAWALFSFGIAIRFVPVLERHRTTLRSKIPWTFPLMAGLVIALTSSIFLGDRREQAHEAGRTLPPAGSPNVLLIVLDTVRADHLSLYGYERATTPMLERLAQRGVRFDEARATAPWTLPSHASMFTGHWPHELGDQWVTPIRTDFTTLAEYMGDHGYATAGFVANVGYCSRETGLARGFTHYEDYVLEKLAPLRTSGLVEYVAGTIYQMIPVLDLTALRPLQKSMHYWFGFGERKTGASIRRAFLHWLTQRTASGRPFFAFVNLCDAHQEYKLPPGAQPRFVRYAPTPDEVKLVQELWPFIDKTELPAPVIEFARDSYDDCLAYLDEQLGLLFYALHERGVLDQTLVVVTADHGEGLGEHNLFDHGESLYRTEIRVPLVIVPPSGLKASVVVDTVSLRDLPATIVDLSGLRAGSPFPGKSLARFWRSPRPDQVNELLDNDPVVSELRAPNPAWPNRGRSPASRGPLVSLAEKNFVYIRNEGDGAEQLFDERGDPQESVDLSDVKSSRPLLERFRRRLGEFKGRSARPSN
jgi:arylsulfatase A-like enzyme